MFLPEQLYLILANPQDGDVGTLAYQPIKRALQGAYAWELVRCGAVRLEGGQVFLVGMGEPELTDVLSWLRGRTEPCTVPQLIYHVDAPVGLLPEHLARRLTRLGFCEEKTVKQWLLFTKTIHPRTPAGTAEAQRLEASFRSAAEGLLQREVVPDGQAVVGAIILHVCGLRKHKGLGPEALGLVVKAGLVDKDLMAELARLTEGEDLGSLLEFLEFLDD